MIEALRKHKGSGLVVVPIIGNPFSTTLTEEEEDGFIEVLRENKSLGWFGDHACEFSPLTLLVLSLVTFCAQRPHPDVSHCVFLRFYRTLLTTSTTLSPSFYISLYLFSLSSDRTISAPY